MVRCNEFVGVGASSTALASAIRARPIVTRARPIVCWTGTTRGSLDIAAPQEALFAAYADIERMPQWSPLLESVVLVDKVERISEWALRVPRPIARLVRASGMGRLVQWRATHETEGCERLRWKSLSGVQNEGEATFVTKGDGITEVSLQMTYVLPDLIGPILSAPFAQRFVRRTLMSTMKKFKETLEAEAAATVDEVSDATVEAAETEQADVGGNPATNASGSPAQ